MVDGIVGSATTKNQDLKDNKDLELEISEMRV